MKKMMLAQSTMAMGTQKQNSKAPSSGTISDDVLNKFERSSHAAVARFGSEFEMFTDESGDEEC